MKRPDARTSARARTGAGSVRGRGTQGRTGGSRTEPGRGEGALDGSAGRDRPERGRGAGARVGGRVTEV
ncbi:hypothetical protein NUW54_g14634 [Trametes sanguinea]|uniref:Uncharacterized protein n=1 Tax=Trametes sanguinea TaxID=158606 RepID=A0ACC1MB33_9APHY|nr:hypothetical protein NUW54_g14634 [Trametes sanguinea]